MGKERHNKVQITITLSKEANAFLEDNFNKGKIPKSFFIEKLIKEFMEKKQ